MKETKPSTGTASDGQWPEVETQGAGCALPGTPELGWGAVCQIAAKIHRNSAALGALLVKTIHGFRKLFPAFAAAVITTLNAQINLRQMDETPCLWVVYDSC